MHEDIKTALDESRKDEERYVYKYPENDLDETKKLDKELEELKTKSKQKEEISEEPMKVKKTKKRNKKEEIEDDDEEEPRRSNIVLIIIVSIFTLLVAVGTIIAVEYFKNNEPETAKIPDVSNKSIKDADNILTGAGFEVLTEYKYISSEDIEEVLSALCQRHSRQRVI